MTTKPNFYLVLLCIALAVVSVAPVFYEQLSDSKNKTTSPEWDPTKPVIKKGSDEKGAYEYRYTPFFNPEAETTIRATVTFYGRNSQTTSEILFNAANTIKTIDVTTKSSGDEGKETPVFESYKSLTIEIFPDFLESEVLVGRTLYKESQLTGRTNLTQGDEEHSYPFIKENSAETDFNSPFKKTITLFDGKKNPVAHIKFHRESLISPETQKTGEN
jgi:hypothetical protein